MLRNPVFEVPSEALTPLMAAARGARLITVSADGTPHLGIFPYIYGDGWIELHLARGDEQLDELRARPRAVLEIDEIFSHIPSYWSGPEATHSDLYYRAAIFECTAELSG